MTATVEQKTAEKESTKETTLVPGADRKQEGKEKKVKLPKVALVPTPRSDDISDKKPLIVRFHVPKEQIARLEIPNHGEKGAKDTVYHIYVPVATWFGKTIPDSVNLRTHNENVLKNPVVEKVSNTIRTSPENFHLANLGLTILADGFKYNEKTEVAEIIIKDPQVSGIANGATSDLAISLTQTAMVREFTEQRDIFYPDFIQSISHGEKIDFSKIPQELMKANIHLEIFVGIEDSERIFSLVEGRNFSKAVKPVSLATFRGEFDWLEKIIEGAGSEFAGKVGYEENARKKVNVLNIVSLLTLMHKSWEEKEEAPTVAYSARGKLSNVLVDPKMEAGFKALAPITLEILRLHDFLIAKFPEMYDKAFEGKSRLARRQGVKAFESPRPLPLTGQKVSFSIPSGFVYPLLQAFRCLIDYNAKGEAFFKVDPYNFFDKYGPRIVKQLIDNLISENNSPTILGKKSRAYKDMYNYVKSLAAEETAK